MKKILLLLILSLPLLAVPVTVFSQGNQQLKTGQGEQQQERVQDPTSHGEIEGQLEAVGASQGEQVQNQVKTQNEGEDSQLQVNTQENLEAGGGSGNCSDKSRQNMSLVAQEVEELLSDESVQGGIGQQVKTIAQQQKQAQGEIDEQLGKLESRRGLVRKLFGTDEEAVVNLKKQMEQNQLRIQQLLQLQEQLTNPDEQTQVQELVQALIKQNTSLQEQVQVEEQETGIFGWLVDLFG